jgi:hypothetical protein
MQQLDIFQQSVFALLFQTKVDKIFVYLEVLILFMEVDYYHKLEIKLKPKFTLNLILKLNKILRSSLLMELAVITNTLRINQQLELFLKY